MGSNNVKILVVEDDPVIPDVIAKPINMESFCHDMAECLAIKPVLSTA